MPFSSMCRALIFTSSILEGEPVYSHCTHLIHSMDKFLTPKLLRNKTKNRQAFQLENAMDLEEGQSFELKMIPVSGVSPVYKPTIVRHCQQTRIPEFICERNIRVINSSSPKQDDHYIIVKRYIYF